MPGEIALVGGEEFRRGCEEMDLEIMVVLGPGPGPGADYTYCGGYRTGQSRQRRGNPLRQLGGRKSERLMVLDKSQADDNAFIQPSKTFGVVYFTGGSPEHLLTTLKDSQLLKSILAALDEGTGAGWLQCGRHGDGVLDAPARRWELGRRSGHSARGTAVLPHHENSNPADTSEELSGKVPADLTVLGIDARTGCLGRPGNWRVVGSGKVTVYRGSDWQVYRSGVPLPSDV